MFRGYWLAIIAVGLTANPVLAQQGPTAGAPVKKVESGNPANSGNPPAFPVVILQTPDQTKDAEAREAQSDKHEAEDLAAQQEGAEASDRSATATQWQVIPAWWQAFLATIGAGALIYSLYLNRKATTAAVKSADAAIRSVDAAIRVDLPILRCETPEFIGHDGPVPKFGPRSGVGLNLSPTEFCSISAFGVQNFGRTPAFITGIELGWYMGTSLPEKPVYTASRRIPETIIIKTDHVEAIEAPEHTMAFSRDDIDEIDSVQKTLWAYVRIKYENFLGSTQTDGFCWYWGCPDGVGDHYFAAAAANVPAAYTEKT
jgi:hypothetical protein